MNEFLVMKNYFSNLCVCVCIWLMQEKIPAKSHQPICLSCQITIEMVLILFEFGLFKAIYLISVVKSTKWLCIDNYTHDDASVKVITWIILSILRATPFRLPVGHTHWFSRLNIFLFGISFEMYQNRFYLKIYIIKNIIKRLIVLTNVLINDTYLLKRNWLWWKWTMT